MRRFLRTERLLGKESIEILKNKRVTVVGLGAVGSYAVEGIARMGVGNLKLIDFDVVDITNINRQLYALDSTVGKPKADIAIDRVKDINPYCNVDIKKMFVNKDNIDEIIDEKPDLVVDAIDSVESKLDLLEALYRNKIPMVSSMGAALRSDPRHIQIGDLFKTSVCPLARTLRYQLKKRGIKKGIPVVYSTEPVTFKYKDVMEEDPENVPVLASGKQRRVLGSIATITGIFGLTVAQRAVEHLLGTRK